jgi:hypothetical protein
MKWRTEMNGQGAYWWKADTMIGPIYADFAEADFKAGTPWKAYWHPYDADNETTIGGFGTEDEAKDAAEKWIKDYARNLSKKLARFAK